MSRICRPEHGLELRAVPALARGDHDRQRFLPLLARQVDLGGQAAAGPVQAVIGGLVIDAGRLGLQIPFQPGRLTPATPARPDLLQLHFHVIGRFRLPVSLRPDLGLPLHPRGVLAAGVKLCPLRVDPARGLVRAAMQLIQPRGAPVISGP
jgi:hypothetical protein